MDPPNGALSSKMDDERARYEKRVKLKELNTHSSQQGMRLFYYYISL
jgi:hypothetical protein